MQKLFNTLIINNFDYNCYQDNRFYTYNPLADLMLFMRDSDAPLKVVPSIFVNDEALKFESGILYSSPDTISRLHRSRNNHTSYAKLVRCIINENITFLITSNCVKNYYVTYPQIHHCCNT